MKNFVNKNQFLVGCVLVFIYLFAPLFYPLKMELIIKYLIGLGVNTIVLTLTMVVIIAKEINGEK